MKKLIDNKVFYDHVASQDKKILDLQQENKELKRQNTTLENEIDRTQEDMLHLKVDMAGIHESGYVIGTVYRNSSSSTNNNYLPFQIFTRRSCEPQVQERRMSYTDLCVPSQALQ